MARPTSAATNCLYGTFTESRFDIPGFLGRSVLEAGVDFNRLRSFLPRNTNGTDSGLSSSLGNTPVELQNFVGHSSPCSHSLPATSSILADSDWSEHRYHLWTEDTGDSSGPNTPQSVASDTENFLAEIESQCQILFTFIKRGINWIRCQLEERSDCVIVPLDHYADITSYMNSGAERPEMSQDNLKDSKYFCEDALILVRQLKDCLMYNLTQLYSILDDYDRAFPEDRYSVDNFRASKRQSINELTGQLEQCQNAVRDHKEYLEARLTVVSWDELMKPQHRYFVLSTLAHLVLFMLGMAALAWYAGYKDRFIGLFYLYRGPMFITLYFYLYSLNLVGWATAKIRYIDIFKFSSPSATPDPYVIFNIAGILSMMFTAFVAMLMFVVRIESTGEKSRTENSEIPERILPLLLWIITAIVLLNPFKWLIGKGRYGVVKVTMRILLAPLYQVRFGDFWFADQLNSIVVILLDLEFMLCFYSYVWPMDENEDGKVCNKNIYGVRPLISCLPAFWRLMQCLRCYYDTRHYPHLINAGKYFTTFPVVVLFALFSVDRNRNSLTNDLLVEIKHNIYLQAWAASSFVHAVYTFVWDIYMDWGLFQSRNLLRPKLGYSWKSLYYLAIVEDLILRFAWSLKLSLGLHLQAQVNLFYTLLAGLEIFRRFVWNFYRVEYEYIKITFAAQLATGNDGSDSDMEKKSLTQQPSMNLSA